MNILSKISILMAVFWQALMISASPTLAGPQLPDQTAMELWQSVPAKTAAGVVLTSTETKEVLAEAEGASAEAAKKPIDIKQPLVWQSDKLSFRLWGYLRNLVNYNHLRNDAALNPDDIFQAPKFINFSEARLKLDGAVYNNLGLYINDRLHYQIDKDSHEWQSDSDNTLDEAYASFKFGGEYLTFLSVGKQRIKWGTGKFWTPVDTINPQQDLAELEPIEEGRTAYRADIAHKSISVTGVAVPDADTTSFKLDNFSFNGNRTLLTGKIDFFVWDSDLALYVSDKQQEATRIGASFATVLSDIQFFGEAIFWNGASEREYVVQTSAPQPAFDPVGNTSYILPAQYEVETRDGFYYNMVLGMQYTFTNDLSLIFEYYYRRDGYDKKDMETYVASLKYAGGRYADDVASTELAEARNPMLALPDFPSQKTVLKQGASLYDFARLRRNYLHLSAYWPYRFGNRFDLGVDTIADVDDLLDGKGGSYFIRPLVAYTGFQDWRFTLYGQLYLGSDETDFGILPYDWGAFFQVKYYF